MSKTREDIENIEDKGHAFLQLASTGAGIKCTPLNGDIHRLMLRMPDGRTFYTAATYQAKCDDGSYHIDPGMFADLNNHMGNSDTPAAVAFVIVSENNDNGNRSATVMITPTQHLQPMQHGECVYTTTDNGEPTIRYSHTKQSRLTPLPKGVLHQSELTVTSTSQMEDENISF